MNFKYVSIFAALLFAFSASSAQVKSRAKKTSNAKKQAAVLAPSKSLKIKALEVVGQKKIEKDAVLNRLISKVGDTYSEAGVRADVLNLFKSGYFYDISVDRQIQGGEVVLTFRVVEKPSVTEIVYEGNVELKAEELAEAGGVKPYELLNMAKVKESAEKIQKLYEDKGFFLAKIDPIITDIKKDETVKLTYKIKESDKVKVKKITLLGNKKISDNSLKDKLFTREEGYFTGISGSGSFKQDAFERDVQIIRMIYNNQGYVQAKIDRPQIYVTPDKKGIYVTIRIEEGEQYYVGEVDFAGDLLFSKEELFATTKIDENEIFAADVLQRDLAELQAKYGDLGYAYTNVIPRWNFNENEKKVNLVFEIDKGNKVYFGLFTMLGNAKTRDKVIRRELKIIEGELYNETRRRQSLENIKRLGFFDEVNFKTSTPTEQLDVMNVEVVVKERNTGQVQVSAGYGTTSGMTFGGSVQQTNFLGRGQNLGVSMQLTSNTSVYDFTFTEPYFNDTLWSLGFRGFMSSDNGRADYDSRKAGGSVSLGHPLGDDFRFTTSYGYTTTTLSPIYNNTTKTYITDYDLFPLNTAEGDASTVGVSLDYDTRNDRFRPTQGMYARAGYSNTGLVGGNLYYNRLDGSWRYFKTVFWDVVFRNSVSYARIQSTDPEREPPFNELFLLGGPYSLRGYRYSRVGQMRFSNKIYQDLLTAGTSDKTARERAMRFYGGEQMVQYQGELQFPLIREAEMYGVVFYDVGQAGDQISLGSDLPGAGVFADWGFGIRWFSPIGPLRFEWGFPMNRDPLYHEVVVFEFSIGTPF